MEENNQGKIIKVVSPFEFIIEDVKDKKNVQIQVKPCQNKCFVHLLPRMFKEIVSYEFEKKKASLIREEFKTGSIYLG